MNKLIARDKYTAKNLLKISLFISSFALLVLLTKCGSNSHSGTENKTRDSLQLVNLKPHGYELLDSQLVDLDQDSVKEYVLFFKSTTHTPCDNVEFDNCFLNELFIAKKVNDVWTEKHRFLLQNPLSTDSVTRMYVGFNKLNLLTVSSSYRPTCCSSIDVQQHYRFDKDNFLMDSLTYSVYTKFGDELHNWNYKIDILQQTCKYAASDFNALDDSGESTEYVFKIKLDKVPTIVTKNGIEDFIPKDSIKYWF